MKYLPILLALGLLTPPALSTAHDGCEEASILNNVDIDADSGYVLISKKDNGDDVVMISGDYTLTINDVTVRTSKKQKRILRDYYDLAQAIEQQGKLMGARGAELGGMAEGIALTALLQLAESFTGVQYIEEDTASDTQQEVEEISADLEEMGAELKDLIKELEATHLKLKAKIRAIRDLDWF
ncbi:MAG: hypothetical protein JSW54_06350 [Fidelibacterota bacterium]|nr:MAG: hypothetical protein JSW54_06350 [Candidatus Neomarinimicrobiota bacterium]